mgnify:FL=1
MIREGFPPRELLVADDGATLRDAGLVPNAMVILSVA